MRNSSKASGDHGSSGRSGEGEGVACLTAMPLREVITSSIASRNGEGVCPCTLGEYGAGECPCDIGGYRSFIEGVGDGVVLDVVLVYMMRCGGGGGGGGEDPRSW